MPSLCSWSWESKLAAKGWRWGQKVNTAIRNHVELKTEATRGLFCVSLRALASPHHLIFQTLFFSQCLLQGWVQEQRASEREGPWETILFIPFVFPREDMKPREAEWLPQGRPAYGRKAGPEHRQAASRRGHELGLWGHSPRPGLSPSPVLCGLKRVT